MAHERFRSASWLVCALAAALAVGSCGGDDNAASPEPTGSTTSSGQVDGDGGTEFEIVRNLSYLEYPDAPEGWHDHLVDVYAPSTGGPHPVVVLYHADPAVFQTKDSVWLLAAQLVEAGAVVFVPTYGIDGHTTEALRYYEGEGPACTYWYAKAHAADYGGDPDDITLAGVSAGASLAMSISSHPWTEAERCLAEPTEIEPTRLVLFEGDYLMASHWDEVLGERREFYDEWTPWRYLDGYLGGPVHFLADENTRTDPTFYRDDPDYIEAFLQLRDPSGDLQAGLVEIGALEDGAIDFVEGTMLLHQRLVDEGYETTLTWLDGKAHSLFSVGRATFVELALHGETPD